jgi:hypothetical protein
MSLIILKQLTMLFRRLTSFAKNLFTYKIPFPLYGSGCRQARIFAANKPKSALSHDFKFIVVF